jgi:hypothetical protein
LSTPIYGFCVAINAIGYAMHDSRSADAVIRVYDDAGMVVETHEHEAISKSGELDGLIRKTAMAPAA